MTDQGSDQIRESAESEGGCRRDALVVDTPVRPSGQSSMPRARPTTWAGLTMAGAPAYARERTGGRYALRHASSPAIAPCRLRGSGPNSAMVMIRRERAPPAPRAELTRPRSFRDECL